MNVTPSEYRPNVGIMLINADNQVFVGQRLDRFSDAWQMPQGGIDQGEDPQTAAYRELLEETGITQELVQILDFTTDWIHYDFPEDLAAKLWKGRYRGQKQRYYLMKFLGRDDQINIKTKKPEFSDWRWSNVNTLEDKIVEFKRQVYRQVISEFSVYLRKP